MRARKKDLTVLLSAWQHAITRSDLIKNALLAATQEAPIPRRLCEKPDASMETEMENVCMQSIIVRAPARLPRHLFFFRVRAAMRGGVVAVKIKYGIESEGCRAAYSARKGQLFWACAKLS
jgi:hypothetical protein